MDDHDDKWAIARILRARVRSCVPRINHRILGELGFQADAALKDVVVLKDRRQSYLQSCFSLAGSMFELLPALLSHKLQLVHIMDYLLAISGVIILRLIARGIDFEIWRRE